MSARMSGSISVSTRWGNSGTVCLHAAWQLQLAPLLLQLQLQLITAAAAAVCAAQRRAVRNVFILQRRLIGHRWQQTQQRRRQQRVNDGQK